MLDFSKEKTPGIARVSTSPADGDLTPPDVKAGPTGTAQPLFSLLRQSNRAGS